MFDWRLPLLLLALVGLAWLLSRQMTLSLVGGVLLGPLLAMGLGHAPAVGAGLALLAALLVNAHRPNLRAALARLREQRPSSG